MICSFRGSRFRNRLRFVASGLAAAVLAVSAGGLLVGQEAEREQMKEPVYRVGTSASIDPARPTRPVLDPALTETLPSTNSLPTEAVDKATNTNNSSSIVGPAPATQSGVPVGDGKTVKDPQLLAALDDASRCLKHWESNVRDYTCVLIKRETVNGAIVGPDYIQTKIRHAQVKNGKVVVPFSVYMRFAKPTDKRGREVLYLHGMNENKVLVKEAGWKGKIAGAVWLARNSSLLSSENRHEVHEVGVLNLTQRLLERGHARDGNVAGVDYKATYGEGAEMNKRPCRFLDIDFATQNRVNEASKISVLFDEELNIPVRYAAYGWPAAAGAKPPLLEEYTYINIAINQGLTDTDFSPENEKYGLR